MGRKLLIFLFLCSCGSGGGSSGSGGSAFCGGSGSASDPYLVCDSVSFKEIKNYSSASFRISQHIFLNDPVSQFETFTGSIDNPGNYNIWDANFTDFWIKENRGTLDGLRFPNLKITKSELIAGVVRNNHGTIKNVTIKISGFVGIDDATSISGITHKNEAGGLIESVSVSLNVPKGCLIGGISVYNSGQIKKSSISSTTLKVTKNDDACYAGGVSADNLGTITEAHVESTSIIGFTQLGGIVGLNRWNVYNSVSDASVTGETDIGGLIGLAGTLSVVKQSYATGTITGSIEHIGGLVGANFGKITESASASDVGGTGESVGGLVGYNNGGIIADSYSTGNVTGTKFIGGFVGYQFQSSITNCYSSGTPVGNSSVGGFAGNTSFDTVVTSCYWDVESSGVGTSSKCDGKTSAEMKNQATFAGWNFINTWIMKAGEYPKLRWMNP